MHCKKTKFASEKFALDELERIRSNKVQRAKVPVAVYLCKCGSWHLTSQPNWNVKIAELEAENKRLKCFWEAEKDLRKTYAATIESQNKLIAKLNIIIDSKYENLYNTNT